MDGLSAVVAGLPDGTVAISLAGDLDIATRGRLKASVREALRSFSPTTIIVDLGRVEMLDSAGIGALVHCWKLCRSAGCALALRNPSRLAYWQLELTGLLDVFDVPRATL